MSIVVARGGRIYGLSQKAGAVDWRPWRSGAVESPFPAFWLSRFRPTELNIRVHIYPIF